MEKYGKRRQCNMNKATQQESFPPKLEKNPSGDININSLANLLEWFLNYDQKVALVRHPHVEELFEWKQADDAADGVEVYPFENAEARFAIGAFQAIARKRFRSRNCSAGLRTLFRRSAKRNKRAKIRSRSINWKPAKARRLSWNRGKFLPKPSADCF